MIATDTLEPRPYQRVAGALREEILTGRWAAGAMLPGRQRLAREHGVALGTLERAVATLISEGMLRAEDRRGTFVAARTPSSATAQAARVAPPRYRDTTQATVGIIADVVQYESPRMRVEQWPAQILGGCEHGLSGEPGFTQRFVNIATPGRSDITATKATQRLLSDGVDALVLIGRSADLEGVVPLAEAAAVPIVLAEYDPVPLPVHQVYVDSEAGGALAARHLRERGYKDLVYLRPFISAWTELRLVGARSALGNGGPLRVFPLDTPATISGADLATGQGLAGEEAGRALLQAGFERGTGVVAPNDAIAMGFMTALRQRGLEAGRDYGLVGFDDRHREEHLTSLRPPLERLGQEAAGVVMQLLRGEPAPARIALEHRLIARSSTAQREVAATPQRDLSKRSEN